MIDVQGGAIGLLKKISYLHKEGIPSELFTVRYHVDPGLQIESRTLPLITPCHEFWRQGPRKQPQCRIPVTLRTSLGTDYF